jgi:hypothetical protein
MASCTEKLARANKKHRALRSWAELWLVSILTDRKHLGNKSSVNYCRAKLHTVPSFEWRSNPFLRKTEWKQQKRFTERTAPYPLFYPDVSSFSTQTFRPGQVFKFVEMSGFFTFLKSFQYFNDTTMQKFHFFGTEVFNILVISTVFVPNSSNSCKHLGIPKMCTFTWCTCNTVHDLAWWWLYESKHVAIFIIDKKLVVFWLNQLFNEKFHQFYKDTQLQYRMAHEKISRSPFQRLQMLHWQ